MMQPEPNSNPFSAARSHEVLMARCQSLLTSLPSGCVFSHLTATALHGLPMSYAMEADPRIHVIRPIDCTQNRGLGVVGHRALHRREVVEVAGLPVTGLADTWVDIGELIGRGKPVGLDDTIVLGDAIATRLNDVAPLFKALNSRVRPRGKCTLLEALELIRVGSASAPETLARILFVRVGLPEPIPNQPIYSIHAPDQLLGIGDLVWHIKRPDPLPDIKVIGEYQGAAFHASPTQRAKDAVRRRGFEMDLWLMEEIWNFDMTSTAARTDTVLRFAKIIEHPIEHLDFTGIEPRFYSTHAMELAQQRSDRRRRRAAVT